MTTNMNTIIKTAVVLTNIITTTILMNITNIATNIMNIIILTADAAVAADTSMATVNKKKHL